MKGTLHWSKNEVELSLAYKRRGILIDQLEKDGSYWSTKEENV